MSGFALIAGGQVAEVVPIRNGITIDDTTYPADILVVWSEAELAEIGIRPIVEPEVPDGKIVISSELVVEGGAVVRQVTLANVPPPTTEELTAYTANARWRAEAGGISVIGLPVHTDDRSKMMLMGARVKAQADTTFVTHWKTADGSFFPLDAATIIALSDAVLAHVDGCFRREAEVLAAIAEGDVTSLEEINAAFTDVAAPWSAPAP